MADLRLPDLNKVLIAGRLTGDPELRYSSNNLAVCRLRIANTRYFKRKDGSRGEDTTFIDAVVFDRQAEFVGDRLKKGRPVLIEGRLNENNWEDKNTGQKRSKIEINAQRVTPLDWDDDRSGGGGGGGGARGDYRQEQPQPQPQSQQQPQPRPIEEPMPEAEDDIPF
ncbi:MAG: single-stranded DNA-binding protein [Candidatus Hydrogenedentota bacterium]